MTKTVKFSLFICLWLFSQLASASLNQQNLKQFFQYKLDTINRFMQDNHQKALQDPSILMKFVDSDLLTVWSAKNTIRAMLGAQRWSQLTVEQESQLIKAYEQTMRRYLYEVMNQYQGQIAEVESIRLNDKQNKGWLTVVLETQSLPDISIDLKIYKEDTDWTIYDFSFQGISFVKMKQNYFQTTFDAKGFEGVLADLDSKNQKFNKKLKVARK
ncbi:MlaC/ttg2D family ABC transporter substrate-binding protein [Kangiella koreensis]|uniref:Toluene tolerance family protein n=1 Tax=Kangiella koreensis (strain DSM 16069 / JCM 12317 / KCTC 12182 / SW-125) TaxID=523791 RepID=C7RAP0_KANKD|nr:ABC transporter substrate-binding protein [Kangiella koreensis]ACV26332.1 toluene tolerance family protein [Kangiella koreensis DSM 16069]